MGVVVLLYLHFFSMCLAARALGIVVHICSQYFDWGTSVPYLTGELILYLMMGWAVVFAWDTFTANMPLPALSWLVAGGVLYTAGVPFFMLAEYRRRV